MPDDRILRADSAVLKAVEAVLKSEDFLRTISKMIADRVEETINTYKQKVCQLEDKLEKAYETIDALEQYSRRNSIRIYGLPPTPNENPDDTLIKFCKEKLNVEIKKGMLDSCHRLGKDENRSKPLLVKFVSREVKREIYSRKSKLKGTELIIREDLTRRKFQLLKSVKSKLNAAWTNDCNIFTKVNGKIIKINNFSDLNKVNLTE